MSPKGQHRQLIADVARLRERHQAGRPLPFNVFAVLRKPSDENHLHSRFLHALLDHRDSTSGERVNLADFVHHVARVPQFATKNARAYRESDRIDLLIANAREAIVIENKIYAGDQEKQLQRYYRTLVCDRGYNAPTVHLRYLTLFGTPPVADSIEPFSDRLDLLSYRHDLPPWLTRCQQRAFDDPPLRETIAQYLELIRRLTGTDYNDTYMNELKKLCKTGDNMLLARDLARAFAQAEVDLVVQLWDRIASKLKAKVPDLPRDPQYTDRAKRPAVEKTISGKQRYESGIHYRVAQDVWITIAATEELWYGVYCERAKRTDVYARLAEATTNVGPTHYTASWTPWGCTPEPRINIRDPDDHTLALLASDRAVDELADQLAKYIAELWKTLMDGGFQEPMAS
ncbi:MAG: PD-(D/E)XK nuclease family protein [Gammaproteobacteria bacterium]|nr:PD-(D/E)XK nuclease family protein [Gammaproteobacteria bacterium]